MVTASTTLHESVSEINLHPLIERLIEYEIDLPLNVLTADSLGCTWTINWNDSNAVSQSLLFMTLSQGRDIATCTTDGDFLYIHDTCGLVKVGTGNNGTKRYVLLLSCAHHTHST